MKHTYHDNTAVSQQSGSTNPSILDLPPLLGESFANLEAGPTDRVARQIQLISILEEAMQLMDLSDCLLADDSQDHNNSSDEPSQSDSNGYSCGREQQGRQR